MKLLSFQAFLELQGKMQETNQKLRIADVQVESLKKQIVHAQLTDKEIQVGVWLIGTIGLHGFVFFSLSFVKFNENIYNSF